MALLGLSILIASVSFLCYRHPPSTWLFLDWFRRPAARNIDKKQSDAPPSITLEEPTAITEADTRIAKDESPVPIPTITTPSEDVDRKAMPPPPPPIFKKSPPTRTSSTTPRTTTAPSSSPSIPSFPGGDGYASQNLPMFPAANSAQRASGGTRGPPRLSALPSMPPASTSSLMPPPARSPLPNRTPAGASSSLAPPPTHSSIPAKPRKKVLLTPGHSPLDWARLSSSPTANLRGLPPSTPYLRVPPSLLKQYTGRKGKDAWTILGGKVYNITPYMPYHPGGVPELMRAAGRDGTKLFGEIHPWVNWEGMLEPCLIGIAVEEEEKASSLEEMD